MDDLHPEAVALLGRLELRAHPEGGFYRETWRSPHRVATPRGERAALTVIHFLLPAGHFSTFHRVPSDEVWQHAAGDAVDLHVLDPAGRHEVRRVGPGGDAHFVVPGGCWQAARPAGSRYALASCVVAPGFEFAEFELARAEDLVALRPDLSALFRSFTRG